MKKRVVVGMSGGVDSSVAATLLKEQGYDVIGVFAVGWTGDAEFTCNWQQEEADARSVAEKLTIPFYTVNLSKEYERAVIQDFFNVYKAGGTPNPDILCNREIKFKALWQAVRQFEPDFIATGHYARIENAGTNNACILKGVDPEKDQTYFLWAVDKEMLPRILFPIGEYRKKEVRDLAKKFNLPTAAKKDSQGICFVGPLKVRSFLQKRLQPNPGSVVLQDGRVIAEHEGVELYTIGQRLGAGSVQWTGDVPPLFVVAKDVKSNLLIVGSDEDTYSSKMIAGQVNWLGEKKEMPIVVNAKIRYRQKDVSVTVVEHGEKLLITCSEPVRAITSGQSVVFFTDKEELLGGAIIELVPEIEERIKKVNESKLIQNPAIT